MSHNFQFFNNLLESKKQDDEACGEIESHHPGYLGSQDTFYVGTIKGVGRIYQQSFVDTYSKWAAAKLYTTKTAITGADLLNDKVLPFFAAQRNRILRQTGDARLPAISGYKQHRAYQDQSAASADKWYLRALS